MGYIQKNLQKDEEIIMEIKLSPLIWVEVFFCFLLVIFIPLGIKMIIQILTLDQSITNKRVIEKSGFIRRSIEEMRLSKIETVEYKQSILGRIFGYGNVKVSGTMSNLVLRFIDKPKEVKNKIDSLLD